jgi:hypothetical protein
MAGWGLLDDFLGFMNWTDWLEGIIRGAAAGDVAGHRITLPSPGSDFWKIRNTQGLEPWSLNEVIALLRSYHVKTYRRGFNSEEIWIHVKKKQARFAEYLLQRAGAPVIMDTVDPRNATWAANPAHGGKMPARWDDQPRHPNGRYRHTTRRNTRRSRA